MEDIADGMLYLSANQCPNHVSVCTGKGGSQCSSGGPGGRRRLQPGTGTAPDGGAVRECKTYDDNSKGDWGMPGDGAEGTAHAANWALPVEELRLLPLNQAQDIGCTPMTVGISVNGVPIWGALTGHQCNGQCFTDIGGYTFNCGVLDPSSSIENSNNWCAASGGEWVSFDYGSGHAGRGAYHYHMPPSMLISQLEEEVDYQEGTHGPMLGHMQDGFPIYWSGDENLGGRGPNGTLMKRCQQADADPEYCLDDCNGWEGEIGDGYTYRYYWRGKRGDLKSIPTFPREDTTENLPMVPRCLRGTTQEGFPAGTTDGADGVEEADILSDADGNVEAYSSPTWRDADGLSDFEVCMGKDDGYDNTPRDWINGEYTDITNPRSGNSFSWDKPNEPEGPRCEDNKNIQKILGAGKKMKKEKKKVDKKYKKLAKAYKKWDNAKGGNAKKEAKFLKKLRKVATEEETEEYEEYINCVEQLDL